MTKKDVEKTIGSFERSINFWYPTMARSTTADLKSYVLSGNLDESTRSCLALLIMALGCAAELVGLSTTEEAQARGTDFFETQNQQRLLASLYFESAFKKISLAQAEFTADAVQCLFFTGYGT